MLQILFKNKKKSMKLKLRLKNTLIDQNLNICIRNLDTNKERQNASETWTLTKRDRKQLNIFERKVYRRILSPVYDNEKENWRILTDKEIYAMVKKPTNRDSKVKQITLVWACTENGRKQNSQKGIIYEFENNKLRGRPRNRWQDEVREVGRIVGGEGWQDKST